MNTDDGHVRVVERPLLEFDIEDLFVEMPE